MSAHPPHRHITHTRADAPRSPTRPLPRACSPRPTRSTAAHARHDEHIRPSERDAAGRRWPQRSEGCCDRQTLRPSARLRCTSP
jgi:hypothetical protein